MKYPTLCDECKRAYEVFCGGLGGISFCHHAEAGNTPEAGVYFSVAPFKEGGHLVTILAPLTLKEAEEMRDHTVAEVNGPMKETAH